MEVRVGTNTVETAFGSLDRHTTLLVLYPLREGTKDQINGRFVAQWTSGGGPDFGELLWSGDFHPHGLSAVHIFPTIFTRCVVH